MLTGMFDREIQPGSAFIRSEEDVADPYNRSEPVESLLTCPGVDEGKLEHCMRLLHIREWTHYVEQHNDLDIISLLGAEIDIAMADEPNYPEISAVLTVKQAAASGGWNG